MSSTLSSFKPQRHGHIQDNIQGQTSAQVQQQMQVQQPKPANYYALELFPLTAESEKHYRKLYGNGIVNDRADDNAGVDLYTMSVEDKGSAKVVHTGVAAKLIDVETGKPVHYYLAPRSSIWKSGVTMANSMGIIDSSYRGELMGACIPIVSVGEEGELVTAVDIKEGDRLFQVLAPGMGWIRKVVVLSKTELDVTSRGAGGFGSTGK
jgi:dUTP pyrophosphatase